MKGLKRPDDVNSVAIMKVLIMCSAVMVIVIMSLLYYASPGEDASDDIKEEMKQYREVGFILIIILGPLCFAPLGIIAGWIFGDPYQRAKLQRNVTKKNYGIVNFVSKGARIMSKIKDFDHDLLFVNEGVWVLECNKVYKTEKDDTKLGDKQYPILPEHVNNIIGIPTIFLDIDTMRPLSFFKEKGDANPIDLASTLKGYVMNQLAKNMFFKKTFTIMTLIVIILAVANVALTYLVYEIAQKVDERLPAIDQLTSRLDTLIKAAQQPTNIVQGGG